MPRDGSSLQTSRGLVASNTALVHNNLLQLVTSTPNGYYCLWNSLDTTVMHLSILSNRKTKLYIYHLTYLQEYLNREKHQGRRKPKQSTPQKIEECLKIPPVLN